MFLIIAKLITLEFVCLRKGVYFVQDSSPLLVYFDTNIFDHIQKRINVTDLDLEKLKSAITSHKLSLVFSFLNIEEILFTLKCSPLNGRSQLSLLLEIADPKKFIVSQDLVLNEVIRSYAANTEPPIPFGICDRNTRRFLKRMTTCRSLPRDVLKIVGETRKAKQDFKARFEEGKKVLEPMARSMGGGKAYPFPKYFAGNTKWLAESFAEKAGVLSECRSRGINGLMDRKVLRMAVGANLSLIYSHDFEGRAPKDSDSRDMLHAVLASSADIFVTHDSELSRILQRIEVNQFRIVDIHTLLAEF